MCILYVFFYDVFLKSIRHRFKTSFAAPLTQQLYRTLERRIALQDAIDSLSRGLAAQLAHCLWLESFLKGLYMLRQPAAQSG